MKNPAGITTLRRGRRMLVLALYGLCAAGIGATFAAAPGRGAATSTRPATVTPADKAAADAQFDKAKALFDQNQFAAAQVENDKALKLDPTNVNAGVLQQMIKTKLAGGGGPVLGTQTATTGGAAGGKIPVLTTQQVSRVRLMELNRDADTRLTGRIDPKVVEDFWQNVVLLDPQTSKTPAAHTAFVSPSNLTNQVFRIRELHDPKYMDQISLTSDPAEIIRYRQNVQIFVLQGCATAECHGGEKAPGGNFRLLNPANAPEQQYTNYYILAQYGNKDGEMIDRESPEKSLLLQYALPWASASVKHPKVDVKRFTGPTDPRGRAVADWIRSLPIPKPSYGIDYAVPHAAAAVMAPAATSAPASAPAAGK